MKLFASTFLFFLLSANLQAQVLYHQDTFHGGVTCVGFSTGLGAGSGIVDVHVEPGSNVRRAYLIIYKIGYDSLYPIYLNGTKFQFDSSEIEAVFGHVVESANPIKIYIKDITDYIAANTLDSYDFYLPPENFSGTNWGVYCPMLYIEYENYSLPSVNSTLWLNDEYLDGVEYYEMVGLNPINTSFPVGLSILIDRACFEQIDASRVWLNGDVFGLSGDSLGMIWGLDNSSINGCNGAKGHFYYQNNALYGLDDDTPDNMMNHSDALADVSTYLCDGSTSYNMALRHNTIPGTASNRNVNLLFINVYTTTCDTFTVSLLTEDTTICKGDSLQFFASGADTYAWAPSTGLSCDDCANPKISPSQTTTYFLTLTKYGNCKKVQPIKIKVVDNPVINSFTSTADTCGENSGKVSNLSASGVAPFTFSLNGNSSSTFSNLQSGVYNLAVEDANGCTADSLIFIENVVAAEAGFTANPDIGFVPLEVLFTNESSFANNYIWYIQGDTLTSENPTYIFDSVGTYTVTQIAYNTNFWCADTSTATIHVYPPVSVFIPNVITVNDDNINDDFTIQLEGGEYIWCTVMNRWGQTVYESEQHIDTPLLSYNLWDGINMFTHEPVSAGVYFYRIVVKSPVGTSEIYTGNLTVVR